MKKTLLLSVVASTMIMAGGDIAPVEPVVEAPVAEVSAWNFTGQGVLYTQTVDVLGAGDLFGSESTFMAAGLQLGATHADLFAGIGAGVEVSAIIETPDSKNALFGANAGKDSAGITQGYLTYGWSATSLKIGRQQLPKSLSPFAFTEGWQMFKNTFDAGLLVNSSLPNTALVFAYVQNANRSVGPALENWDRINPDDGVWMVTAQNKSLDNTTITGTWYYAPDMEINAGLTGPEGGDINMFWGDATYKGDSFTVGIQGGQVSPNELSSTGAFGAKIAGTVGMFGLAAAYSSVDDGTLAVQNYGTGIKTPLYTQGVLNQNAIKLDSDTWMIKADVKGLGGKWTTYYQSSDLGAKALSNAPFTSAAANGEGTYDEFALMYKAQISENWTGFGAYVYQDDDRAIDTQNFVRFWARYNFK